MPAGRVLWARFGGSDWAFCITTIRFAGRWESYVLNRVNKALLRSPYVFIIWAVIPSRFPAGRKRRAGREYPEK